MKKYVKDMEVCVNQRLSDVHFLLILSAKDGCMPEAKAGQFVEVKIDSAKTMLRRPISINYLDTEKNELWLLVAEVGDGTRHLAALKEGDTVNVMLPLGNGFPISENGSEECLLVGGGVGVAPLLYLGAELMKKGHRVTFLLGARSWDGILMYGDFEKYGRLLITTEDGSEGVKGFVTDHPAMSSEHFDKVYVCGPTPMMKAVTKKCGERNMECYVSLENKMACGLGACLCCVTEDKEGHNRCVCTEGPVFNTKELPWQI